MHLDRIDLLRALAILLVFTHHAQICLFPGYKIETYGPEGLLELGSARDALLNLSPIAFGWTGVHLFLLISGFLIHLGTLNSAAKGNEFSLRTFFSKRFWRIYPPYLLALLFFCFSVHGGRYLTRPDRFMDLMSHVFMVHNLSDTTFFSINPSFWSIALEVQLYLIYPALLLMRRWWGIARAFSVTIALYVTLTLVENLLFPGLNSIAYTTSVLRFWSIWCAGAFLAERFIAGRRIFFSNNVAMWVTAGGVIAALASICIRGAGDLTIPCVILAWLAFFEWILHRPIPARVQASLPFKAMIAVGLCSYSIYLIHQPYLRDLLAFFGRYGYSPLALTTKVTVVFAIIFLLSYALYRIVEQPSIAWGARLRATRASRGKNDRPS